MKRLKFSPLVVNLLLAAASTALTAIVVLTVGELYLRQKASPWEYNNTDFDPELGWASIPNRHAIEPFGRITSNSFGFRSPEIDDSKEQIVVIGDSVAWGDGVDDQEAFPFHLQELLDGSKRQVSNLAVSGYGVDQYYLFLKRHIEKFKNFKLLIVVFCTRNDRGSTRANIAYGKRKPLFRVAEGNLELTNQNISKNCLRNLVSKSRVVTYLTDASAALKGIVGRLVGDVRIDAKEGDSAIELLIARMSDLAGRNGAKVLFVISPEKADFLEKSEDQLWFENFFENSPYRYINLYDSLKPFKSDLDSIYRDKMHYADRGNRIFADQVFLEIEKLNL
jgi:hypothetical protein